MLATSAIVVAAPTQAADIKFPDVKQDHEFYNYIMDLVSRGVIHGMEDGTFKPELAIRRDHAAKIIAGALNLDVNNVKNPNFKDVPTTHPEYKYIAAIANAGIVNGDGLGNFLPGKNLTRGEMAKIIANAYKLQATQKAPFGDKAGIFEAYIDALYSNNVTKGKSATSFAPNDNVKRGELAAFVIRAEEAVAALATKAGKLASIDGDTITINGVTYLLATDVKAVFNEKNEAALKDGAVSVVVRQNPSTVASLGAVANEENGTVVGINYVTLQNNGTTLEADGYIIPEIIVTGTNVKVENVAVGEIKIEAGASAVLDDVMATTVTAEGNVTIAAGAEVSEIKVVGNAKITVEKGASLDKIVLEEGKKLEDVIANYNEIKDEIKDVPVEQVKPETPGTTPSTPGDYTPPTPSLNAAQVEFKQDLYNELNKKIPANISSLISLKANTTVNYALNSTVFEIEVDQDATYGDVAPVLSNFIDSFIGNNDVEVVANLTWVKIGSNSSIGAAEFLAAYKANELQALKRNAAFQLANTVFGTNLDVTKTYAASDKLFTGVSLPSTPGKITFKFADNGREDTIQIKVTYK